MKFRYDLVLNFDPDDDSQIYEYFDFDKDFYKNMPIIKENEMGNYELY